MLRRRFEAGLFCGQGRGRTGQSLRFRRTLRTAELPGRGTLRGLDHRLARGSLLVNNVEKSTLTLADGRLLHVYDAGPTGRDDELVVCWHHGTPNIGTPPEPLFAASVPSSASGGSRSTGPAMAVRRHFQAVMSLLRPSTPPRRLTRSASIALRLSVPFCWRLSARPRVRRVAAERVWVVICSWLPALRSTLRDWLFEHDRLRSGLCSADQGPHGWEAFALSSVYDPEFTDGNLRAFGDRRGSFWQRGRTGHRRACQPSTTTSPTVAVEFTPASSERRSCSSTAAATASRQPPTGSGCFVAATCPMRSWAPADGRVGADLRCRRPGVADRPRQNNSGAER